MYKALHELSPEYIADLQQEYVPTQSLRSAGAHRYLSLREPLGAELVRSARQLRSYGTLCQQL